MEENKIAALRARSLEQESRMMQLMAEMRTTLAEAEEEERRLKAESLRFDLEFFTEAQAAKKLGISKDTLARKRVSLKLPHMRIGVQIKYSDRHLFEIYELLEKRKEKKEKKSSAYPRSA